MDQAIVLILAIVVFVVPNPMVMLHHLRMVEDDLQAHDLNQLVRADTLVVRSDHIAISLELKLEMNQKAFALALKETVLIL